MMINPLGSGPNFNPLGGVNPLLGNLNPGAGLGGIPGLGGPQDLTGFSPEALGNGLGNAQNIGALMQALGGDQQIDPKQLRILQLQQEIPATEQALQQAQAMGNQPLAEQLGQKLQQLQAELQQLMGGDAQQQNPGGGDAGGGAPAGGGGAPADGGGVPAGGGGNPGGGGAGPVGGGNPTGGANNVQGPGQATAIPNPELAGNDAKLAETIEQQLKGTPLEGQGLGAHFVQAGRERNVDPLALVAISKHETDHGRLGVGIKKHMGVGAYDSNPNGKTPFDGAVQQIYSGAKTFDNLRRKGGSSADAPMSQQLAAVNRAGWATDGNWHNKVGGHYNTVVAKANTSSGGGNQTMLAQNNNGGGNTSTTTKKA